MLASVSYIYIIIHRTFYLACAIFLLKYDADVGTIETCSFVFIILYGIIHYPLSVSRIVDQYTYISYFCLNRSH